MPTKYIEVKWTPFALQCLDEIYDYIVFREKSISPAQKLIDRVFIKTDQLGELPESGQPEPLLTAIGQDSRYLVEPSYKIIYEYHSTDKLVIITDIFHTSQNPAKVERSSKNK